MTKDRREWECPKCHEHFFQYIIDGGFPVCHHKAKDCPAKQTAHANQQEPHEQTSKGLEAAIRAAKLALFVIRKQDVMPNSSWEAGFNNDLKTAEDAMAALAQQIVETKVRNISALLDPDVDRYRHKVRGTTYRILFEAAKASSIIAALDDMTMVVYQGEADGLVWVRPAVEFFDGRFEKIVDPPRAPVYMEHGDFGSL